MFGHAWCFNGIHPLCTSLDSKERQYTRPSTNIQNNLPYNNNCICDAEYPALQCKSSSSSQQFTCHNATYYYFNCHYLSYLSNYTAMSSTSFLLPPLLTLPPQPSPLGLLFNQPIFPSAYLNNKNNSQNTNLKSIHKSHNKTSSSICCGVTKLWTF